MNIRFNATKMYGQAHPKKVEGEVEVGLTGRDANVPTEVPFPRVRGLIGRGMGGCRLSTSGSAEPWCIGAGASAGSHRRLAMKVY